MEQYDQSLIYRLLETIACVATTIFARWIIYGVVWIVRKFWCFDADLMPLE